MYELASFKISIFLLFNLIGRIFKFIQIVHYQYNYYLEDFEGLRFLLNFATSWIFVMDHIYLALLVKRLAVLLLCNSKSFTDLSKYSKLAAAIPYVPCPK